MPSAAVKNGGGFQKGAFMMDNRFVKIYSQGFVGTMEIWVDTQTGVNYIFRQSGYGGGLTVLVDREGKPIVSALPVREE